MSDTTFHILFPLDEDSCFRRECPYCRKEFKIQLTDVEINSLSKHLIDNFLKETTSEEVDVVDESENTQFCPYCHQSAPNTDWWTPEQLSYAHMYAQNMLNEVINNSLIKEMKKMSRSNSFFQVKCKELDYITPWISPEDNDMDFFNLPCCGKKMKIDFSVLKTISETCCYECGFHYRLS